MYILFGFLRWTCFGLAVASLAASLGLLIGDSGIDSASGLSMAAISAAPLFLAGISFLLVQSIARPSRTELLKNVLLAATFLLWGVVQLMPQTATSRRLGNLVIALYVLDLAWATLGKVMPPQDS
jgi:hypothetical protein